MCEHFLLFLRDEGKIARKLLECVNTYLLRDGPNLGSLSMAIHESLQQFVLRFWLATHDPGLKVLRLFNWRMLVILDPRQWCAYFVLGCTYCLCEVATMFD